MEYVNLSSTQAGSSTPASESNKKNKKKDKIRTGVASVAKKALCGILAVGILGAGGYGAYLGIDIWRDSRRATSLVKTYTDEDGFCTIPKEVTVNKAYDIAYTSGEHLMSALTKGQVKYCQILDEYYTEDGMDIAILTFRTSCQNVQEATKVSYGDNEIYLAPPGYILSGEYCYQLGTEDVVKVVPRNTTGDYSGYTLEGIADCELISAIETSTKPYSEIIDYTLICDVEDGAVLNQNEECSAVLRLMPKKQ